MLVTLNSQMATDFLTVEALKSFSREPCIKKLDWVGPAENRPPIKLAPPLCEKKEKI